MITDKENSANIQEIRKLEFFSEKIEGTKFGEKFPKFYKFYRQMLQVNNNL